MFPWEDKPLRVAATGWHAAACPSPATSPAHSPVPSVGRGGEGEAASVGTSGRPPLQEQRGRLQEGPGPGGSPSPVCSWGRGGSRGLRGREHPGVRCLALAQGATGIGAATEREYRARGARGHSPGAELSAAPGNASEVGSSSSWGTPVGLDRQAPEDMCRPGLGPVLSGAPFAAPGPWVAGQSGLPPAGGQGPWAVEAGPPGARRLAWLWPVSRQRQTGARSPARPPPPAAVLRDCPAHEEHLQRMGPPRGH